MNFDRVLIFAHFQCLTESPFNPSQYPLGSVLYSNPIINLYSHSLTFCLMIRHLNSLDEPMLRSKWTNCKKALLEEVEVVKQLDAELRLFKEIPGSRRPSSPPIQTKSFVFQPLDEYPTSSASAMDDPDVWRPPSRDQFGNRRPARAGQLGAKKSSQDGIWARGSVSKAAAPGRGGKSSSTKTAVRPTSAPGVSGKKGKQSVGKTEPVVRHLSCLA